MENKKIKIGLLPRLIIAIILGVIIGNIAKSANLPIVIQLGATFNSIFGNFLGFAIPLIIIGFVVPGIADLGEGAGKTLALTALAAYVSTIIAGSLHLQLIKLFSLLSLKLVQSFSTMQPMRKKQCFQVFSLSKCLQSWVL